jgi:hypothetical protein
MDSHDELMMTHFLREGAHEAAEDDEKVIILSCLLRLNASLTQHGDSRSRKRNNKDPQRMAGSLMLEIDYFCDSPTHIEEFLVAV